MNKKLISNAMVVILLMACVTAGIIQHSVSREVHIDASFNFAGENAEDISISGGNSLVSNNLLLNSQTSVNVPIEIVTSSNPEDSEITHTTQYILNNIGGVCGGDTCEKRIFIQASDVGIETLDDLNTIQWEANISAGYLPHIDVILQTDALVFEYAKVDTPCDNAPYPIGIVNTFDDKGIVDLDAMAWLSSGPAGYCGLDEFDANHKTLTEWKAIRGSEEVIGFELEVDNWVSESSSTIKNILINGNPVKVTLKPSDSLEFNVISDFSIELGDWDGTITTEVTANKTRA